MDNKRDFTKEAKLLLNAILVITLIYLICLEHCLPMQAVLGESPYFFSPQGRKYDFPNHTLFGTLYVCGKLPTYPSPRPTFCPK